MHVERVLRSGNAIELRRALPADVDAITTLVRAAYAAWVPVMGREPMRMLFDYARGIERHRIDLHHRDGELAALIETYPGADHLFILNVAVAPVWQGHGLGGALMAHAEQEALASGFFETRLFTNKLMAANQALYEHLGYEVEREEPFRGGVVVHMSKTLAPR